MAGSTDGPVEERAPDPSFIRLLDKLHDEYGFDFREYKLASLIRRIDARMHRVRVHSYDGYMALLDRHPEEHVALFNAILINVTTFFRDADAWRVLGDEVIPRLIDEASDSRGLRIWSAGCSSGEEAYSIAMVLAERLAAEAHTFNVKIYATDVDDEALATARHGLYRAEDVKNVPPVLLDRYFAPDGRMYRIRRELRRWCIFGRHNVGQDPPLSHLNLLVCRNVLIYFTSELQERILARFHYSVRERGFLFLGRAESLLARSRWFVPYQAKWRIFQRTATPAPTVAAAARDEANGPSLAARTDIATHTGPLHNLFDAMPSGVIMIDPEDNILVWNETAGALFDIPPENAAGRKFRDLDVSYRVEGLRAHIEEVKASQIPVRIPEVAYLRRSGETTHADIVIVPVMESQHVTAVAVFVTDVTDTMRVKEHVTRLTEQHATAIEELQSTNEELETTNEELQSTNEELETTNEELQSTNEELETTVEELQAANAELAAVNTELGRRSAELKRLDEYHLSVLSSLEQAVVVLDRDGVTTTWSRTAERLWALRPEHVVGRPFWSLPVGKELAQRIRDAVPRVIVTGAPETLRDVAVTFATGEARSVVQLAPLKGLSGETMGVSAIVPIPDLAASSQ